MFIEGGNATNVPHFARFPGKHEPGRSRCPIETSTEPFGGPGFAPRRAARGTDEIRTAWTESAQRAGAAKATRPCGPGQEPGPQGRRGYDTGPSVRAWPRPE